MTFYVKVPPNKGKTVSIFKFENAKIKKKYFEYDSITIFSDVRFTNWLPDKFITHKLPYKAFFNEPKDSTIIVPEPGFRQNEIVFTIEFSNYDVEIPLIDQMICTYFKIKPKLLIYKQNQPTFKDVPKELILSLVKKEKLTRQEKKLLGI